MTGDKIFDLSGNANRSRGRKKVNSDKRQEGEKEGWSGKKTERENSIVEKSMERDGDREGDRGEVAKNEWMERERDGGME